ncbi:MAG: molybdopterin and thiamine biosynthesis dinucleotide-utilizing enzyme [Parcubacteria group bacterium]|nr:molybdopterin and thiamine biosynthesis dinucleotide-utilizing enzyme [Parcubacteria group bacterium]
MARSATQQYTIFPLRRGSEDYSERTDRNIGWITKEEQLLLREAVVGIAGCGGMGGLLAAILVRMGVGEVRIADCETFDQSNVNRQFAAQQSTIGKSKAVETARLMREIADDTTIAVYPLGITEDSVESFVSGCDLICDEIELLAMDARILLHQRARSAGVPLLNCNSIGFSTNLFLYTPGGIPIEEVIGCSYERAKELCRKSANHDKAAMHLIIKSMLDAVVPEIPEYRFATAEKGAFLERLMLEEKVSIIASNPPMATGFLANRLVLQLLGRSTSLRSILETPLMPLYLHFDAAHMRAETKRHPRYPQ